VAKPNQETQTEKRRQRQRVQREPEVAERPSPRAANKQPVGPGVATLDASRSRAGALRRAESTGRGDGLPGLPFDAGVLFEGGTVEAQADVLQRLAPAQRQAAIQRIGQVQGNQHVQRVVAAYGGNGKRRISPSVAIQTKLEVGQPDDEYEQEADAVAETVMRMPAPAPPPPAEDSPSGNGKGGNGASPTVSRLPVSTGAPVSGDVSASPGDDGAGVRPAAGGVLARAADTGEVVEEEGLVEAEPAGLIASSPPPPPDGEEGDNGASLQGSFSVVDADLEERVGRLKGSGSPLPPSERDFFESRFGADFGDVRVHSDGAAAQTAEELGARAYTVGSDIAFGAGEYAPGTERGRRLMAHELTHVIQQGGAGEMTPQRRAKVNRCTTPDCRVQAVLMKAPLQWQTGGTAQTLPRLRAKANHCTTPDCLVQAALIKPIAQRQSYVESDGRFPASGFVADVAPPLPRPGSDDSLPGVRKDESQILTDDGPGLAPSDFVNGPKLESEGQTRRPGATTDKAAESGSDSGFRDEPQALVVVDKDVETAQVSDLASPDSKTDLQAFGHDDTGTIPGLSDLLSDDNFAAVVASVGQGTASKMPAPKFPEPVKLPSPHQDLSPIALSDQITDSDTMLQRASLPDVQRISFNVEDLIPDWAKDILSSLRGDAGSKKSGLRNEGSGKSGELGDISRSEGQRIKIDGDTQGAGILADGDAKRAELLADQEAQEAELLADQEAKEAELLADQEAKEAELLADQEAKEAELLADREAKEAELLADQEAKEAELLAAKEAKEAELRLDATSKRDELEGDAQTKARELNDDWSLAEQEIKTLEVEVEQRAEADSGDIQAEAQAANAQVEAVDTEFKRETQAVVEELEQEAESIAEEQGIEEEKEEEECPIDITVLEEYHERAPFSLSRITVQDIQRLHERITTAWTNFMARAGPMLAAIEQKWQSLTNFVNTQIWEPLQKKAQLFRTWIGEQTDRARRFVQEVWEWLQERWSCAEEWIQNKAEDARQWIADKADAARVWIQGQAEDARQWIADQADAARVWVQGKAEDARQWIADQADVARVWVQDKAEDARQWIGTKAEDARQWIGARAESARQWIGVEAEAARNWIQGKAKDAVSWFESRGRSFVTNMSTSAQNAVSDIASRGGPILQFFGGIVNGLISGVESVGHSAVNTVSGALSRGLSWLEGQAANAVGWVESCAIDAITRVEDKSTGVIDAIGNSATNAVTAIENGAVSAITTVESVADGVVATVESIATDVITWLETVATDTVNGVEGVATDVVNGLENAATGVVDLGEQAALGAIQLIKITWETIKSGWNSLKAHAAGIFGLCMDKAQQAIAWIDSQIIQPAVQGLREQWDRLKDWFAETFPELNAKFQKALDYLGKAQTLVRKLTEVDYGAIVDMEGLEGDWGALFWAWVYEASPLEIGEWSDTTPSDIAEMANWSDTNIPIVTITSGGYVHDIKSRVHYHKTMDKFIANHCADGKVEVGDFSTGGFTFTGPGSANEDTEDYQAMEWFLGSYDIRITAIAVDQANRSVTVRVNVLNESDWSSGTRVPAVGQAAGFPPCLVDDTRREEWGPGGSMRQNFVWEETFNY
jgi:hypothetical protein